MISPSFSSMPQGLKEKIKISQLCLTLCNAMDHTVHGILHEFQARILEWVAFPFSGDLPHPGIEPRSPTLQADSLPTESQRKPLQGLISTNLLTEQFNGIIKELSYY